MTNPNNAIGTNGAFDGRTSPNALNDITAAYTAGIISGWACAPKTGMTVTLGGSATVRDVALAEDNADNKLTINNRSGAGVDVTLDAAPSTNNRIDAIVAYVDNPSTGDGSTTDNPTACGIIAVKGTVAANPVQPSDAQIRSAITTDGATGGTAYYVILATIRVGTNVSTIGAGVITQGAKATTDGANLPTINTANIADGAITTAKLAATSVTNAKIDWTTVAQSGSAYTGNITIGPLLIQWGRESVTINNNTPTESAKSVTFDKTYKYNPNVFIQSEDIGGVCAEYNVVSSSSTTGFSCSIGRALNGSGNVSAFFRWMSIGIAA